MHIWGRNVYLPFRTTLGTVFRNQKHLNINFRFVTMHSWSHALATSLEHLCGHRKYTHHGALMTLVLQWSLLLHRYMYPTFERQSSERGPPQKRKKMLQVFFLANNVYKACFLFLGLESSFLHPQSIAWGDDYWTQSKKAASAKRLQLGVMSLLYTTSYYYIFIL